MTAAHGLLAQKMAHFNGPQSGVTGAIARASARTGVDFNYLLNKAKIESSLNPTAKARTSSATGLYQFTQSTWLEMVRDHGDKYGLSAYAKCIDQNCQVKNSAMKQDILALRNDPETAAVMAAEYASRNEKVLQSRLGDNAQIGETELYLAHFMGAGGASKFLNARADNPNQIAAKLFPAEARANRAVFYDPDTGRPRTLAQIYDHFDRVWQNGNTVVTDAQGAQEGGQVTISRNDVDRLLATPVTSWNTDTAAAQVDTILQDMKQAQLLVLAQTYLHADNNRYNA